MDALRAFIVTPSVIALYEVIFAAFAVAINHIMKIVSNTFF